jgi:predicted regulator of Ras-like GTPase activity (Roadblock/LC7/MglB family)
MQSSSAVRRVLGSVRDVEGVQGSFALSQSGGLLAKDLPAVFDESLFAVVGPRLLRFHEALESQGETLRQVVLRFAQHKLHVRSVGFGFFCVLCDLNTNTAALSMAMGLAAKELEPELAAPQENDPPATLRAEPPASSDRPFTATLPSMAMPKLERPAPAPPAPASRAPITYRGRRLG